MITLSPTSTTSPLLPSLEGQAWDLLIKYGLANKGWTFEFDSSLRRYGHCIYSRKLITISKHLASLNPFQESLNIILHEIAHALAGPGHHHNHYWKRIAQDIGCTGDRCYDSAKVVTPQRKWKGTCVNGHTTYAHRRRNVSCSKCSRIYDPQFKFVWTEMEVN